MQLTIPDFALVVLIGPSGSGKSSFAARHFKPTEILSSDRCRGWVADDETDQEATGDAFEVVRFIAGKRLAGRRLTVIDATNVRPEDRKPWIDLARHYHALPAAIVFDVPAETCIVRNRDRPDRQFAGGVVRSQLQLMRRSQRGLGREGFRHVFTLAGAETIEAAAVSREPLYTDRRSDHGPFDIIGDVHGCSDELCLLFERLGYRRGECDGRSIYFHPEGRRPVFVGDLVDRGPAVPRSCGS